MDGKIKVVTIGTARGVRADIDGVEYYFLYNGSSIFKIQDEFGPCVLPEEFSMNDREGAKNILRVSELLTESAAQACKEYHIDDVPVFRAKDKNEHNTMPYVYLALRKACADAADIGYVREIKGETEEVDLVLLKHQKKTGIQEPFTSKTE